jgi:GT2 family glycosyltransferase
MAVPLLSIGLVTYNSAATLSTCLNSIARYCPFEQTEILVVDNNSDDGTIEILQDIPFISRLIRNYSNKGFAAGVNQLMEEQSGRHLLLLNPDCQLQTPILHTINEIFSASPIIGVIGADVRDMHGRPREAYGVFPSPAMVKWDFSGLRKIIPRRTWSTSITFRGDAPIEVDYPTGAFYCIRDKAIEAAGAFDERFFAYFEEVDYAFRLKQADFRATIHPSIRIRHLGGGSFIPAKARYDTDFQLACYFDSLLWFLEKYYGGKPAQSCREFIRASASFKAAIGGNTDFGRRHRQVVRILDRLKYSSLRRIYGL